MYIVSRYVDITGKRFGRLVVLSEIGIDDKHKRMWNCICDCGNSKEACTHDLIGGRIRSCGCLLRTPSIKHGLSHSPIYKTLVQMKARCYNPNHPEYKNYGARGISICNEWLDKEH